MSANTSAVKLALPPAPPASRHLRHLCCLRARLSQLLPTRPPGTNSDEQLPGSWPFAVAANIKSPQRLQFQEATESSVPCRLEFHLALVPRPSRRGTMACLGT